MPAPYELTDENRALTVERQRAWAWGLVSDSLAALERLEPTDFMSPTAHAEVLRRLSDLREAKALLMAEEACR